MCSIDISGIFWYQFYSESDVPHFLEQTRQIKFLQDYSQGLSRPELFSVDPPLPLRVQAMISAELERSHPHFRKPRWAAPDRCVLPPSRHIKSHPGLLPASSPGCNDTSKPWAISFGCISSASGWLDKGCCTAPQSLWWIQFIKGTSYPSSCKWDYVGLCTCSQSGDAGLSRQLCFCSRSAQWWYSTGIGPRCGTSKNLQWFFNNLMLLDPLEFCHMSPR